MVSSRLGPTDAHRDMLARERISVFTCVTCVPRCRTPCATAACVRLSSDLLANTESFNDRAIARFIDTTQIVEQPAPPTDQLQETTP